MSTISKVFTILNVVLALFLVGTVASILARSDDYKDKWTKEVDAHKLDTDKLQAEIDAALGETSSLKVRVGELGNQKSNVEISLQTMTAERDQLRNDNNGLRTEVGGINTSLAGLQTQLADAESRNKTLMDQNESYSSATAAAEAAKLAAENDRARLDGDLARRDDDVAAAETQVTQLLAERDLLNAERSALVAAGVNIHEIIGDTEPLIEATVSDVGTGFVVLSVGESDGVRMGYSFDVYRGPNYIGQVVVDKVFPDNSIARVVVTNPGEGFQRLDNATTRL